MTYFVLLGILLYKNKDDDAYLFMYEDQLCSIAQITMLSYIRQDVDIDNRLALFCSTFDKWFFYVDDPSDEFKVPFKEVYEHV